MYAVRYFGITDRNKRYEALDEALAKFHEGVRTLEDPEGLEVVDERDGTVWARVVEDGREMIRREDTGELEVASPAPPA